MHLFGAFLYVFVYRFKVFLLFNHLFVFSSKILQETNENNKLNFDRLTKELVQNFNNENKIVSYLGIKSGLGFRPIRFLTTKAYNSEMAYSLFSF